MRSTRRVALVLALTVGLAHAQRAWAQKTASSGASTALTPAAEGQAFTRFSRDGAAFIDAVRAARRAIFEGDPKTAKNLMRKAKAHVDKANEHFKKGEAEQAVEELRLAQIGVSFTRQWAPIGSSEIHLDDAIDLADADKYYEANLSLKAIEDGITTDSMTLLTFPKK